jgi:hypothetical protein
MKKISSGWITFYKRMFPLLWFGGLASFAVSGVTRGAVAEGEWMVVAMPFLMAAFGFVLMKKVIWDLADEVEDYGASLLVRKSGEEERISLSNIMNVNASTNMSPQRITLRLARPGRFGTEVAFMPPMWFSFNPFAKNPVAEDLIVRVDRARRERGV